MYTAKNAILTSEHILKIVKLYSSFSYYKIINPISSHFLLILSL